MTSFRLGYPWLSGWVLVVTTAVSVACAGSIDERNSSKVTSGPEPLPSAPEPAVAPPPEATPVGRVVPVGPMPEGLVFDARTGLIAIGVRGPDALVLLDRDGREVRRISLDGAPRHLGLGGPGGPVLVPAEGSDQLVAVTLPDGRIQSVTSVGRNPHDAVAAAGRVFVGNEFGDSVSVVEDGDVVGQVAAPIQPGGLGAAGDAVAIVGVRGRQTKVVDASSLRELGTVVTGAGPTHVVGLGDRLFVADTNGAAVLVLSTAPEVAETARIDAAGAPYGLAVDPVRQHLWVTLTASNQVLVLDVSSPEPVVLRTLPSVRQPNSVAVDPESGTVYVAGTADGVLQIISPDVIG